MTALPSLDIQGMKRYDKWLILIKLLESDPDLKEEVAKMFGDDKSGNLDKISFSRSNIEDTDSSKKRHSMPTVTRSFTNSIPSKSNSTSFNFDSLLSENFAEKALEAVAENLKQPFSAKSLVQIEQILSIAEAVKNNNLERPKTTLEEMSIEEINGIAAKAMILIETLQTKGISQKKDVVLFCKPLNERIGEICQSRDIQCFKEGHQVDKEVRLPKVFKEHFERVLVKGDGNCLWHSVSIALFGDYSASEALRLLTAATLIEFEREFRGRFDEQETKFGYKPDVTYDQLLATSTQLGVWGDEYHAMALSMAIRRPINSYGDFDQFKSFKMSVEAEGSMYEKAKMVYESNDLISHYRYVGFEEDDSDDKEPVCIFYDGQFHYSVLLPRNPEKPVVPWKPKTQLLEYMVPSVTKEAVKESTKESKKRQKSNSKQETNETTFKPENTKSNSKESNKPLFKEGSYSDKNIRDIYRRPEQDKNVNRVNSLKEKFEAGNNLAIGHAQSREQRHTRSSVDKECEFCHFKTDLVPLDCLHGFCSQCFTTYLEKMTTVSEVDRGDFVLCPYQGCEMTVSTELIRNFFPQFAFLVKEVSGSKKKLKKKCPRCQAKCEEDNGIGTCASCQYIFCTVCRGDYHGNVQCSEASKQSTSIDEKEKKKSKEKCGPKPELSHFEPVCKKCQNPVATVEIGDEGTYFTCADCDIDYLVPNKELSKWEDKGEKNNCSFQLNLGKKYKYSPNK